ncbi:MAG TPA: hypothetical protein VGS21_12590 [Acidimicrobiales bacterium]|nr:hypothetical protein [Acidimicrobiales bacterium]
MTDSPDRVAGDLPSRPVDDSGAPVASLRGAGVEVDARRVVAALGALGLLAMSVLVVVLAVAGADKNAQITRLHRQGVPVTVEVQACVGLIGGSGSNVAGYQCRGAFTLEGSRYVESIPSGVFLSSGTELRAVAVPGDPGLVTTTAALANEHASWKVFALPAILLILDLLVAGGTAVLVRRRRRANCPPAEALPLAA